MVVALRMDSVPLGELLAAPMVPRPGRASRIVAEYLSRQISVVRDGDARTLRAATGRLRATLSTLRPVLAHDRVDRLRGELHWLADTLEALRDNDMVTRRLTAAVAAEPDDRVAAAAWDQLREGLAATAVETRGRLTIALDAPRFAALLDSLDALAATIPRDLASGAVLDRVRAGLRQADHRLDQVLDQITVRPSTSDICRTVDRAARAYRWARYGVELAGPLRPDRPRRLDRLDRRLATAQKLLDRHHDATLTEAILQTYATLGDGFSYGVLLGRQPSDPGRLAGELVRAGRRARRAIPPRLA